MINLRKYEPRLRYWDVFLTLIRWNLQHLLEHNNYLIDDLVDLIQLELTCRQPCEQMPLVLKMNK